MREASEATAQDVSFEAIQVENLPLSVRINLWPEGIEVVELTHDANCLGRTFLEHLLGVTLEPTVFCEGCSGYRLQAQPTEDEIQNGLSVPPEADPDERALAGFYVRNHWFDRQGEAIRTLVLHGTCSNLPKTLALFTRGKPVRVGAHYIVTTNETLEFVFPTGERRQLIIQPGIVLSVVPEAYMARHAGMSFWKGAVELNASSIGIEVVNRTNDKDHWNFCCYSNHQIEVLCRLIKYLSAKIRNCSCAGYWAW